MLSQPCKSFSGKCPFTSQATNNSVLLCFKEGGKSHTFQRYNTRKKYLLKMRTAGSACLLSPAWGQWSAPIEFGKNENPCLGLLFPQWRPSYLTHCCASMNTQIYKGLANILFPSTLLRRGGRELMHLLTVWHWKSIRKVARLQLKCTLAYCRGWTNRLKVSPSHQMLLLRC